MAREAQPPSARHRVTVAGKVGTSTQGAVPGAHVSRASVGRRCPAVRGMLRRLSSVSAAPSHALSCFTWPDVQDGGGWENGKRRKGGGSGSRAQRRANRPGGERFTGSEGRGGPRQGRP